MSVQKSKDSLVGGRRWRNKVAGRPLFPSFPPFLFFFFPFFLSSAGILTLARSYLRPRPLNPEGALYQTLPPFLLSSSLFFPPFSRSELGRGDESIARSSTFASVPCLFFFPSLFFFFHMGMILRGKRCTRQARLYRCFSSFLPPFFLSFSRLSLRM